MVKISAAERREQFLLLMGGFIFSAILLSIVIFQADIKKYAISKVDLEKRVQADRQFEQSAKITLSYIDSVGKQINRFDPSVQAVFLENDIKKIIHDIQQEQSDHDYDKRYELFKQVALLYSNYFVDRRELKGNSNDVSNIQKSLDDCIVNRKQLQEALSRQ